jgi:hypothetical protein
MVQHSACREWRRLHAFSSIVGGHA